LQIAVNLFRCLGDEAIDRPRYLTFTIGGEQAANCADYLTEGRSVAIEVQLVQGGHSAEGVASAVYFVGSVSRAGTQFARA